MNAQTPIDKRAFGIDVSRHQELIDWDIIAIREPRVDFVAIRSTISWGYIDNFFTRNWAEAKRCGLIRAAYHVVYPKQSVLPQADNIFRALDGDFGELPIVLDIELHHDAGKALITNTVLGLANTIFIETGRSPILYSRALFVDEHMSAGSWRGKFDWWLAQYYAKPRHREEYPEPTRLPSDVTTWRFHQNCINGEPSGVESAALDYNRFNGTPGDLEMFTDSMPSPPPDETPDLIKLTEQVNDLTKWAENIGYKKGI